MRISDWSSDVCSSDLRCLRHRCRELAGADPAEIAADDRGRRFGELARIGGEGAARLQRFHDLARILDHRGDIVLRRRQIDFAEMIFVLPLRSEEHTSELQSLMRISYAVFCLKQKNKH